MARTEGLCSVVDCQSVVLCCSSVVYCTVIKQKITTEQFYTKRSRTTNTNVCVTVIAMIAHHITTMSEVVMQKLMFCQICNVLFHDYVLSRMLLAL